MKGVLIFLSLVIPIITFSQISKKEKRRLEEKEKINSEYAEWKKKLLDTRMPRIDDITTFELIDSVTVIDIKKEKLITAFKVSLSDILKEAKKAIDVEDKESGIVIAKVNDVFTYKQKNNLVSHPLKYTLKYVAKDGKFRLRLTDIEIGEENLLYYRAFNREISYFKIDQPELSEEQLREEYDKLNNHNRELLITIRAALRLHLQFITEGLGSLLIKNSKDNF